jgi:hypothetical protein
MAKRESKTNDNQRGRIDTRLVNTGIYNTYEQHFVADDGTDIRVGRVPIQSQKPIRAGEVLAYIAAEVQTALHDGSGFKGEAQDAVKMLDKLKAAVAASDVESVAYWSYFLGCAMERHHTRQYEPMVLRERTRKSAQKDAVKTQGELAQERKKWVLDCYAGLPEAEKRKGRMAVYRRITTLFAKQAAEYEEKGRNWTLGTLSIRSTRGYLSAVLSGKR